MNQQLQVPQPPNPVSPNLDPTLAEFKAMQKKLKNVGDWSSAFTLWLRNNFITPVTNQVNTQTQGFSTAASASSISLSTAITHVTGSAVISTINAPATFGGVAWLVADAPFSLTTGGNIAESIGPVATGSSIQIVYDPSTSLWYPSANNQPLLVISGTSPITAGFGETIFASAASGADCIVNLPAAAGHPQGSMPIRIKRMDANTAHVVAVTPAGSDTIDDGGAYPLVRQYESLELVFYTAGKWAVF